MWVPDGTLTSRWAPGSYTVVSLADVEGLHGPNSLGLAMLTAPEVDLTTDRNVDLDASRARQVKVATPQPTTVVSSRIDLYRSFTSNEPTPGDGDALHRDDHASRRLRQPVGPPDQGEGEEGQLRLHHQVPRRADAAGDHLPRPPPRRRPRAARFPRRCRTAPHAWTPSSPAPARRPTTPACPPAARPWSYAAATPWPPRIRQRRRTPPVRRCSWWSTTAPAGRATGTATPTPCRPGRSRSPR